MEGQEAADPQIDGGETKGQDALQIGAQGQVKESKEKADPVQQQKARHQVEQDHQQGGHVDEREQPQQQHDAGRQGPGKEFPALRKGLETAEAMDADHQIDSAAQDERSRQQKEGAHDEGSTE